MLKKHKFDFEYYHVNADFNPIFDKEPCENEYLLIVNYYGQLDNDRVTCLRDKHRNIILDNTHTFFKKPIDGIDTIYSCGKFFGVPDGAYLSTNSVLNEKLEVDISKDRMIHILGRFEGTASDYYSSFRGNDALFKLEPLKYMSRLTKNILGAIDYEKVKKVRNENYAYLDNIGDLVYNGCWAEMILHADNYGMYDGLWVNEIIKPYVIERDLWIRSGDIVHGFTGANEAIGTLVL